MGLGNARRVRAHQVRRTRSWVLSAAALGMAGAAAAQDAPAPAAATQLDAVTVRGQVEGYVSRDAGAATKSDTPIAETPQSVSVVTREQIDAQQATTLSEVLRYTAGVTTQMYGADNRYSWYNIRGFSANDYTFQDGLRLMSGYFMMPAPDPYGFDSVEIVRGPSSVLYGQASPGGLVDIRSKLPAATATGNAGLLFGNYDLREGYADSAGPITADLDYRIAALGRLSGTQVDQSGNNRLMVNPAVTWKPFEGTRITFLGSYQDDDTAGINSGTFSPALKAQLAPYLKLLGKPTTIQDNPPNHNFDVPGDDLERDSSSFGYLLEQRIDDAWSLHQGVRVSHIGGYYKYTALVTLDLASPNVPYEVVRRQIHYNEEFNSATVDTHAQAKWNWGALENTALLGIDYQNEWDHYVGLHGPEGTVDLRHPDASPPPPEANTVDTDAITRGSQVGFYGQLQTKYDGRWIGTASLRRDWAPYEFHDGLQDSDVDFNDHKWTYRVGGVYLGDYGLAPYLSYATSFEPNTGFASDGVPFKPSLGRNLEAGLRWAPANGRASVTLSAFDIHNRNVVLTDPSNPDQRSQAGEVRSRGFELDGTAHLFHGLDLVAAYTYLDAKNLATNSAVTQGKRPQNVPRNTAALWLDYTRPRGWLSGFGVAAGVRYTGAVLDYTSTYRSASSTLFDAAAHHQWRAWRLSLNLDNALNRVYEVNCGAEICNYGDLRTIRGAVSYSW